MALTDRRAPSHTAKPTLYPCNRAWCSYRPTTDPEDALLHMFQEHTVNRRVAAVSPNAGRRAGDPRVTQSPWVTRARAGTLSPGGAMPTWRGRLS